LLYGEQLDPVEIDKLSSIKSNESYKKGEPTSGGKGVRKGGMWSIRPLSKNDTLLTDLEFFRCALDAAPKPLTSINGVELARISVWLYDTSMETSEILINLEDLELINDIGAEIYLTVFRGDVGLE
jgi:hypothetical protein